MYSNGTIQIFLISVEKKKAAAFGCKATASMHSHSDLFLAAELIEQIDRVDFLGHVADQ